MRQAIKDRLLWMVWIVALVCAAPMVVTHRADASADLVGEWTFDVGAGLGGVLAFRPDGTYSYSAGVGRAWRAEHNGQYSVHHRGNIRVLLLRPTEILQEPPFEGNRALGARRLMDNSPHEFELRDTTHYVTGQRMKRLRDLDCTHPCTQEWSISPR
jgi:hypothetical protein